MDGYPDLPKGKSSFDRMIQGLRRKDPELNELCANILIRCQNEAGANVVHPLVTEAALPGKHPAHAHKKQRGPTDLDWIRGTRDQYGDAGMPPCHKRGLVLSLSTTSLVPSLAS
jgi:hypothetical protein